MRAADPGPEQVLAPASSELAEVLRLLVERLRGMALTRLEAGFAPEPTRVAAARAFAQRLADAAAGAEAPSAPVWRDVPEVGAGAAGDLVAVTGYDLLAAARSSPGAQVPRRRGGTVPLAVLLAELTGAGRELRLRL